MPHKLIPIEKLRVQEGYNDLIRSPKEVAANAKEVALYMETQGDNPELFPIRYVEIDGQKFTRNHATLIGAQIRGWKEVYAVKSPHEPGSTADYLDLLLSNNAGHPVGRVAQGRLYKELRDGQAAEDSTEEAPKWIREPMTEAEIGEACKPVYSSEHVRQCIVLAESSPEIQALMEDGSVSANVVVIAKGWAKDDDAKQLRILKAALKNANSEGKDKATKKHLDAIKSDFVKLKAAGAKDKPKDTPPAAGNNPPEDAEPSDNTNTPPESFEPLHDPEAENLFAQAKNEVLEEGSKKNKKLIEALKTFLLDDDALTKLNISMTLNDDEAETLALEVIKIVKNADAVF